MPVGSLVRGLAALVLLASSYSLQAQPSDKPPKFALLVGVGDYAQHQDPARRINPLQGPKNDIALMKDLLVKQYGFPDDKEHILTLVDSQATRDAITAAFKNQLTENAKKYKDATVVFLFSGHGSQTTDIDGDEGDQDDETLVAYDSRLEGGRDIVDDEINVWVDDLQKYTSNITLIFDSCHSGSATRDLDLTTRTLPPNPNMASASSAVGPTQSASKDVGNGIVPQHRQYVAISGSLPNELSNEGEIKVGNDSQRYGFLTYYLVQTLRSMPGISYHQAIKQTEAAVSKRVPTQHPQVEGDIDRVVFGGSESREDPYIQIVGSPSGDTFTIAAGAVHGLQEGTVLAVYTPDAKKLSGDEHKIANARISKVGDLTSTAVLLENPAAQLTQDAKVRIVTPNYGFQRLRVLLSELSGQTTSEQDKQLLARIADNVKDSTLVQRAESSKNWAVSIQRGCVNSKNELTPSDQVQRASADCKPVYYLAPSDRDYALFGLWTPADNIVVAAGKLSDAIESRARQENIRFLDNAVSPLLGKLHLSLVKVEVDSSSGTAAIKSEKEVSINGSVPTKIGDYFRFQIRNDSEHDLHVAVVWLGTSGKIGLYTPTPTGELLKAGATMRTKPPLQAGPPLGLETYKVIATTIPGVNFQVLQAPGPTKAPQTSPLEWVLNQSVTERTRDPGAAIGLDLNSWTTDRVDLLIQK
ncbi:caspase family protein [Microvirga sp. 0TCS3.31]